MTSGRSVVRVVGLALAVVASVAAAGLLVAYFAAEAGWWR